MPSCVGSCGGDDFVFVVFIGVVVAQFVVLCCCYVFSDHGDNLVSRNLFVVGCAKWGVPLVVVMI